ncbi:hypothetical protein M413DRAFT_31002 [Hebeloma cylindrosporum]|uniref:Uncharacterized protein n=1 Tax=Hebeloma cylindrosporum TaxID=76867 RepID=A0A0C3BZ12_HEBCY|nr:hypothetical protein M413DRAFT_31002 [Hebeloma cylindrosporum h7]
MLRDNAVGNRSLDQCERRGVDFQINLIVSWSTFGVEGAIARRSTIVIPRTSIAVPRDKIPIRANGEGNKFAILQGLQRLQKAIKNITPHPGLVNLIFVITYLTLKVGPKGHFIETKVEILGSGGGPETYPGSEPNYLFLGNFDVSTVPHYYAFIFYHLGIDDAKIFRIVEAKLFQEQDMRRTEYIVFKLEIGNGAHRYHSFKRLWRPSLCDGQRAFAPMFSRDLVANMDDMYSNNTDHHLLATLTFPSDGRPLYVYQVVLLAFIIEYDENADPRPVWDPYRHRYARLLMNLLEEEYMLEVDAVPLRRYQSGMGWYVTYNLACKDVLQATLDEYRGQVGLLEDHLTRN